jgi:hypothetical protein
LIVNLLHKGCESTEKYSSAKTPGRCERKKQGFADKKPVFIEWILIVLQNPPPSGMFINS